MGTGDLNGMISVLVLALGVYILYAFFQMKRTGEISETLLSGKAVGKRCRDKEAFLKEALPHVLLLGIATVLFGIVDLIHNFVKPLGMVDAAVMIVFGIALVWYMVITSKLKKKYY